MCIQYGQNLRRVCIAVSAKNFTHIHKFPGAQTPAPVSSYNTNYCDNRWFSADLNVLSFYSVPHVGLNCTFEFFSSPRDGYFTVKRERFNVYFYKNIM